MGIIKNEASAQAVTRDWFSEEDLLAMPDEVQQALFALYNAQVGLASLPMQSLSRVRLGGDSGNCRRLARHATGGLHVDLQSGLCLALLPEEIETWN